MEMGGEIFKNLQSGATLPFDAKEYIVVTKLWFTRVIVFFS